jgi:hypothetical protein
MLVVELKRLGFKVIEKFAIFRLEGIKVGLLIEFEIMLD